VFTHATGGSSHLRDSENPDTLKLSMRSFLTLALLLGSIPVFSQSPAKPDEIITQENAFWKAYADGNAADLTKLLLPDFTNVEDNIWNRDQVLRFVTKFHSMCKLAPVAVIDPHVSFITPDIATVVYHATETPTCGTRTMSGDTNISTIWLRRDGRWQMHLHTEYAIPPK
jgi:hypothetical protein